MPGGAGQGLTPGEWDVVLMAAQFYAQRQRGPQ